MCRSAIVALLCLIPALQVRGGTVVRANISTSTRWTVTGSPYYIENHVYVEGAGNPILTIDPGVTIKVSNGRFLYVGVNAPGGLNAVGTAAKPIMFTSVLASPTRGSWGGVMLGSQSRTTSKLAYASIKWAGWGWNYPLPSSLYLYNTATVQNVTVSESGYTGISVLGSGSTALVKDTIVASNTAVGLAVYSGAAPRLENVTATGNGNSAFQVEPDVTLTSATGLVATGNWRDAVEVTDNYPSDGSWVASATWRRTGLPYLLRNRVTVMGYANPVLTIEPGTTVRFETGDLVIGSGSDSRSGGLLAVGTAALPIAFTTVVSGQGQLVFTPRALSTSRVAYANFEAMGVASSAAISVDSSSPSIENLSVMGSLGSAILARNPGANPRLMSVTATNNAGGGLRLLSGATASISGFTATGNGGPAISQEAACTLASASGLAASGNSMNGIEIRDGYVQVPTTWKRTEIPYFATGDIRVAGNSTSTLSIEPGVVVKFSSGKGLSVGHLSPGGLTASGTEALPITLTSSAVSPTPGSWSGVTFGDKTLTESALRWTGVEWAGSGGAGVTISGASPTLENMTITGSSGKGLSLTGAAANPQVTRVRVSACLGGGVVIDGGAPQISSATFSSNAGFGIRVVSGAPSFTTTVVDTTTSGSGGTGNGVDLTGGSASFSLSTVSNSAAAGVKVSGGAGHKIRNCLIMGNAAGLVSTIAASEVNARFNNWNAPSGPSGSGFGTGQSVSAGALFDPWLTASPNFDQYFWDIGIGGPRFNPLVGSARWDLASLAAGTWTLTIRNSSQSIVRTLTATGSPATLTWDGNSGSGVLLPDGDYTYTLANLGPNSVQATPASGRLFLDSTHRVEFTTPLAGQTLSNVYSNGQKSFAITGWASSSQLAGWTLRVGSGAAPPDWTTLASGSTSVSNGNLATWNTAGLANGPYTLRLSVVDTLGAEFVTTRTLNVGHFGVTTEALEFNPRAGEYFQFFVTVPFTLDISYRIRNEAGQTVRSASFGTHVWPPEGDVSWFYAWDGKNDSGAFATDGLYTYVIVATDGTHTLTQDLSAEKVNVGGIQWFDNLSDPSFATFDPFNGRPLTFTYQPNSPGRATVIFSPKPRSQGAITGSCSVSPEFCRVDKKWQSSRLQTIEWSGTEASGKYRPDVRQVGVVMDHTEFPRSGVIVYGSPTKIANLSISPQRIRTGVDTMQVSFDVTLPNGEARDVFVEFVNQESLSTLRTIALAGRSSGHVSTAWDGRSDSGMIVAEGTYLVRAWTTDGSGNRASAELMTRIDY